MVLEIKKTEEPVAVGHKIKNIANNVLFFGLALSTVLFAVYSKNKKVKAWSGLERDSALLMSNFESREALLINDISSLARYIRNSDDVTEEEFIIYTKELLRSRKEIHSFINIEHDEKGYRVKYVSPAHGHESLRGLYVGDKGGRDKIYKSIIKSGMGSAAGIPLHNIGGDSDDIVSVIVPVFKADDDPSIIECTMMMSEFIKGLKETGMKKQLSVVAEMKYNANREDQENSGLSRGNGGYGVREKLKAPFEKWEIRITPLPGYFSADNMNVPFVKYISSILATLILTLILRYLSGARIRVSSQDSMIRKMVLDSMRDGYIYTDESKNILNMNKRAGEMTGYEPVRGQGLHITEILRRADGKKLRLNEKGDVSETELMEIYGGKKNRFKTAVTRLRTGSEGGARGFVYILTDMTHEMELNESLKESREISNNLTRSLPIAVMIYQDDKWVYANHATEIITGYTNDEIMEKEFWDFVHPDFVDVVKERGRKRQKGEKALSSYRLKIIRKNGDDVWVSLKGTSIVYQGRSAGLISVIDIDDIVKTSEALTREQRMSERYLNSSPVMMLVIDENGDVQMINDKACEMLEMDRDKVVGLNWVEHFILPEDRAAITRRLNESFLAEERFITTGENRICSASGRVYEISWYNSSLHDDNGEITGVLASGIDVTEKKELERQLRQTEKIESLGLLAGGVAHDFNNMLTGILGGAELLKMALKQEQHLNIVNMIYESAEKASSLTRQLLDFSRKGRVESQVLSIHDVVGNTVEILKRSIDKRIRLERNLDAENDVIKGDPAQVENMIINICINGCDAMPNGGVLNISTENTMGLPRKMGEERSDGSGYIRISIKDTGTGIEENNREKIFMPFFTTKEQGKGTGLGLSSVYGAVKSHGGFIDFQTAEDEGTVFHVYFPVIEEKIMRDESIAKIDEKMDKYVMVIDDEKIVRETVAKMLESLGCRVVTADSGEKGIEIYRREREIINTVILDLRMPGMNGEEVFRNLKEIDSSVHVIICSGYVMDQNVNSMLESGARAFIQKPFTRDKIMEALNKKK